MKCVYCGRDVQADEKGSCPFCGAPVSKRLDPASEEYDPELALRMEEDMMASKIFWAAHNESLGEFMRKRYVILFLALAAVAGLILGWIILPLIMGGI